MKVLFLANIPSPYRIDFFNELGKYCSLTVLFERRTASDRDRNWNHDEIKNFNSIFLRGINIRKDTAICPSVLKYLIKGKYDVFVVGGYSTPTGMLAIEALRIRQIKFFLNCDGGILRHDNLFFKIIKKHFIGSANWWLTSGALTTKWCKKYGATENNIFEYPFTSIYEKDILNNPLTTEQKQVLRADLGINYKKVVISVGQFIHRKGFDILIEAWDKIKLKDAGLFLIGGGPDTEKLTDMIKSKEINNIHLIEFQKKQKIKEYYKCADVFVLPTREDIWGLVVNEAMCCGLPIVSTNKCNAALELVKNNINGFIIDADDIEAINQLLANILFDESTLYKFGCNSLQIIRGYTIESMAAAHLQTFDLILN